VEIIIRGVVPYRVVVTDEEAERIKKRDEAYKKSAMYKRFCAMHLAGGR
jgi:hypothetical protein